MLQRQACEHVFEVASVLSFPRNYLKPILEAFRQLMVFTVETTILRNDNLEAVALFEENSGAYLRTVRRL